MSSWWSAILLSAVTVLACATTAHGQGQLAARLETESHQGGVTGVAADKAGRIAVTQGIDGTARIWSLPDLRLLRVLRAPVGASLQQVAIAPDGTFVAASSGTVILLFDVATGEITRRMPVRSTIAVDNHLKATPVSALAISPDGRRIAIGRGDNEDGCWIYIIRLNGTELSHRCNAEPGRVGVALKEFTLALSFAPDGRLAVATSDGRAGVAERHTLILLDTDGNVARTAAIPGWVWFNGLTFSPDGKRLAVAHRGVGPPKIEIRDGTTLAVLATADSDDLSGALPTLLWNATGTKLLASGYHAADARLREGDPAPVYAWDNWGTGHRRQAVLGGYRLAGMALLPDDRILMVTNNRDLEVADRSGSILSKKYPDGVDLRVPARDRGNDDGFRLRVSRDGSQVEFVTLDAPDRWLHVDAYHHIVTEGPAPQAGLDDWTVQGARFSKGNIGEAIFQRQKDMFERPGGGSAPGAWFFNQVKPFVAQRLPQSSQDYWLLNGRGLKQIDELEPGRSQPPRTSVAAGRVITVTDDPGIDGPGMHAFDLQGHRLWTWRGVTNISRVNQSRDGRFVVAAATDGTIRWYQAGTGRLILSLFVARAANEWIFFTPRGDYWATPEALRFVGWLIGRGAEQSPDFFSVAQFGGLFFDPDIVDHALHNGGAQGASQSTGGTVEAKLPELPPIVAVTSPRDGSSVSGSSVRVDYVLRSPSGRSVRELRALVDGRPVPLSTNIPHPAADQPQDAAVLGHADVPVPSGRPFTLSLLAATRGTQFGPAAVVRLLGTDGARPKRRLFVLSVGPQTYARLPPAWQNLRYTARDAEAFAALLQKPQQKQLYDKVQVRLLADVPGAQPPTRHAILDGLNWLRQQAVLPDDVAVFFVSSHGAVQDQAMGTGSSSANGAGDLLLLPTDVDPGRLADTAIAGGTVLEKLKDIPGHVILLIDACRAGSAARSTNRFAIDAASPWTGMFVFTSSTADQVSFEDPTHQHGVFTTALLEALNGKNGVNSRDGIILTDYLASYLARRIPELGRADERQTPTFSRPITTPDFRAFAIVN
jgi:hypothetical protein